MWRLKTAKFWLCLLALVGIGLFLRLGFWQLDRATHKQTVQAALTNTQNQPFAANLPNYTTVQAMGALQPQHAMYLDNQLYNGQPGYHLLVPLQLPEQARYLLVDFGWLSKQATSNAQPALANTPQNYTGVLAPLPAPGLRMGPAVIAQEPGWPAVVNYPTLDEYQALLGKPVFAQILWLGAAPQRLQPNWQAVQFGPEKHWGYAVQWFALALTVLIVTLILLWRSRRL